ncbi:MAG: MlaD family protein [Desulfuromonadales bacterium]|nr:MlaD family protein [Desulfuromonadales bacterium]
MAVSTEQKVGLFFLISLLVLGIMIELVEDWRPFEKQIDFRAYFKSAVGLKEGDPVRVAGVDAGKVRKISIEDSRVRIDFYVNDANMIREDSLAQIRQTNLLGGVFLGLDFGSPDRPAISPGGEVRTQEGANIDQLISNIDRNQDRVLRPLGDLVEDSREPLAEAIRRLERIATKIDEGQGTIGLLVNDPGLYDQVTTLSSRLNTLLVRLEAGEGTMGKLLSDPSLYDNLNRTANNFNQISEQVKTGKGTLGKLVNDEKLYDEATGALANVRTISDKVNRGEGTLGKLVNDDELYRDVHEGVGRINSIAKKIDEGEGTLGRLINEDDIYRDTKTTLHKVEKTVDGMGDTGPLSALGVVLGTLF